MEWRYRHQCEHRPLQNGIGIITCLEIRLMSSNVNSAVCLNPIYQIVLPKL